MDAACRQTGTAGRCPQHRYGHGVLLTGLRVLPPHAGGGPVPGLRPAAYDHSVTCDLSSRRRRLPPTVQVRDHPRRRVAGPGMEGAAPGQSGAIRPATLGGRLADAKLAHPAAQGAAIQAQDLGGAMASTDLPLGLFQDADNVVPLDRLQGLVGGV